MCQRRTWHHIHTHHSRAHDSLATIRPHVIRTYIRGCTASAATHIGSQRLVNKHIHHCIGSKYAHTHSRTHVMRSPQCGFYSPISLSAGRKHAKSHVYIYRICDMYYMSAVMVKTAPRTRRRTAPHHRSCRARTSPGAFDTEYNFIWHYGRQCLGALCAFHSHTHLRFIK